MKLIRSIITCMITALVFFMGIVPSAKAEENFQAKDGLYVGLSLQHNSIEGDFNGDKIFVGPDDFAIVPSIDSGLGYGISGGIRVDRAAFEIGYIKSDHDYNFIGLKGDAEFKLVSLDGKLFFLTDQPMQPFIQGGLTLDWLIIKDGSATIDSVGDAKYFGLGLNGGGGVAFYINPRVALNAGVVYRFISYATVKGAGAEMERLEDNLSGSGLNFNTGVTFTF